METQGTSRRKVEWGHLLLIVLMMGSAAAYLIDARSISLNTGNLALVQPAAAAVFILSAIVASQAFTRREPVDDDPEARRRDRSELGRVALLSLAFGAFVMSLDRLGFDLATFLFVAGGLYLCGERRLWVVLSYAAAFTVLVVMGYQQLVPYPFPMAVL